MVKSELELKEANVYRLKKKEKQKTKFLADQFNWLTSSRKTKKANARTGLVSKTGQKEGH